MANFVWDYIKKNKHHIENSKIFLEDKDWAYEKTLQKAKKEFSVQSSIVSSIIGDLEYFVQKAETVMDKPYVKNFIDLHLDCVRMFNNRCEVYMSLNDWTKVDDDKVQQDLLKFFNDLRKEIASNNDDIIDLNLEIDVNNLGVNIYADKKIPFLMRHIMERRYPQLVQARDEYHSI